MFTIEKYKDHKLRKSKFGHFFFKDGVVCAYNSLKMETVYFAESLHEYIIMVTKQPIREVLRKIPKDMSNKFVDVLNRICNHHIFVPLDYDELNYLKEIRKIIFNPPSPRVMVLHLTDHCNLRCRYCFIEGGIGENYKRQSMTCEVIRKSIDKFAQIVFQKEFPQKPSIVFYGGEPLLNWKVIKDGLEYISNQQKKGIITQDLDKVIITNGTLVNYEIAEELKKHNVLPSVSIDGPKKVHDFNRIYKNGLGTFEKALSGFHILRNVGLKPTIATVLSPDSIPFVKEIAPFFLDDLKVKALGFNHVSIVPGFNSYDPVYEERAAEAILKVQDIIQDHHPEVYERRMNRKLNCFLDKQILRADCTGCGEQISISPKGEIGICQGYMGSRKTFSNSVFSKEYLPFDDPVFCEWSFRSPLNMEQCINCEALSTCGGGCPRNADFLNGSIWEVDSTFCHFAKKAQEWMIWRCYQKTKGE